MNPFSSIIGLLRAALEGLAFYWKAKPILAVQASAKELREIKLGIIRHEEANTPADKRLADTLRVFLPEAERLHDALLAAVSQGASRDGDPHIVRAIPVPD